MFSGSAPGPDEQHRCYYPLPDSDGSTPPAKLFREAKEIGDGGGSDEMCGVSEAGCNRRKARLNKYALAGAILASANSILLGYDIGVMSGAVLYIKDDLKISTTKEEILVGSLNVCSLIGSFAAGKTSDLIGRRYTIILAALTFLFGSLLMGFAPSFLFLLAGRVVAGIGVGYSLMIAPVYVAELSPVLTRGFLTSLPEVFINLGILLGYVSNYSLANLPEDINWRLIVTDEGAVRTKRERKKPRWLSEFV